MKKQNVLAIGIIGAAFVGCALLAFGNPIGAYVVVGLVMAGARL